MILVVGSSAILSEWVNWELNELRRMSGTAKTLFAIYCNDKSKEPDAPAGEEGKDYRVAKVERLFGDYRQDVVEQLLPELRRAPNSIVLEEVGKDISESEFDRPSDELVRRLVAFHGLSRHPVRIASLSFGPAEPERHPSLSQELLASPRSLRGKARRTRSYWDSIGSWEQNRPILSK